MVDRAQTLEPAANTALSERAIKEVVPLIVEVATMLIVADKLGPLSTPDLANSVVNYIVLYGSGIVSRFGADVAFGRANEQDINTKNSFVKGLLTAMATSYFLNNPNSNVATEAVKTLKNLGDNIGHSLATKPDAVAQAPAVAPTNIPTFTPVPPTLTPTELAPTLVPAVAASSDTLAQISMETQGLQNTLNTLVLSAVIGLGVTVPIGIGIKLYGEKIAKKFAEMKQNIGETIDLSRDFFSKLRNVGQQSPESLLENIDHVSLLVETALADQVNNLDPRDYASAKEVANRLNEVKMTIHDLEMEVRDGFGLPRQVTKRSRLG